MIKNSTDAELEACLNVANLMVAAARTAPKARGFDSLYTLIVTGEEKDKLADYMKEYGEKMDISFFVRDSINVKNSPVVV
ncbi:MAG: ferredoxin, partial [Spirochaetes bacterium]